MSQSRVRLSRVVPWLSLLVVLLVGACGKTSDYFVAKEEPWRDEEERACLASGVVRASPFLTPRSALGAGNFCGALQPFTMSAADNGRVALKPAAALRCPMVPQVERWVRLVVEPAARATFGVPLVELKIAASYSCRPMNNVHGGRLSEHGRANAIDVAGFVLADGRTIMVKTGWHGAFAERTFLRRVHDGACQHFTTVLSPNYDANHRDHFHLDLARQGRDGSKVICK
ncbi:MAG: extensin family protein [Hyphomicrobiaceae bacterium]|jgi:hypothetical protein